MSTLFNSSYKSIFILSLLIHLITAFFSDGYHHPDEHFQILEFCNYKLGNISSAALAWEFKDQSRQALPVFIAFLIIKSLYFIKITNPFTIAFILRSLTGLSAWFISRKLCLTLLDNFKTDSGKKLFVAISMLLWFVPYIHVRFSSENLAGIAFLFAIYLLLKLSDLSFSKKIASLTGAGLLLGFTFFFRFQMGFAIIGLGWWALFIHKMNWKNLLLLFFAGSISVFVCICIDYWFYNTWIVSPVNYFITQIVHDVVSGWGVKPWWYYFYFLIIQGIPPISILLLVFFFIGLYRRPSDIFSWCLIPFIIAHFAVGHKEMRFMFPMVFSFTYLAAVGIDYFIITRKYEKAGRFLFVLSVIINIPLLMVKMITPAQEAIRYYKFLYDNSLKKEMTLLCSERNVYELVGLNVKFYQSPNVRCIAYTDDQEISNYLMKYKPDSVYLLERRLSTDKQYLGYKNESIYCLFPKWIPRFNINNWESRARIWNIQELRKVNSNTNR